MASELVAGDEVAHFVIRDRVGAGGMGVVYRALDRKLGRDVALKVLPPEALDDAERRARFLREARAAAAVTHANIVTVYEVGEDGARVFVAMELVEGSSLRNRLDGGAMDERAALDVTVGIARALVAAHARGIVHRDIKPDNVMLASDGSVKVLDFGLAKWREAEGQSSGASATAHAVTATAATEAGRILGTPAYMSPEQALGGTVDRPCDVFSLGVVTYEMLSGARPFVGDTTQQLLVAVARDAPVPMEGSPHWPLLERMLAKAPADRPTAADVVEALSSAPAPGRAAVPATTNSAVVVAGDGASRPRRRAWVSLGVAVAATVAVGAAWRLLGRTDSAPEAGTAASASASASVAGPKGVGLLDLPEPARCNDAARAAYRGGLRDMHDGVWELAHRQFKKAAEADPGCAEANLRLSQTGQWYLPMEEVRRAYKRAVDLRDRLSERDQVLLDAFHFTIRAEPPSRLEMSAKFREGSARFPGDAELLNWGAYADPERARAIAALEAATRIDPAYSDAWQTLATTQYGAGQTEKAEEAFSRCIAVARNSADCLWSRADFRAAEGRCEAARDDWKAILAIDESQALPRFFLADAQLALGAPLASVRQTLEAHWEKSPPDKRKWDEPTDQALVSVLQGDFAAARTRLAPLATHRDFLGVVAHGLILSEIELETASPRAAAAVARKAFADASVLGERQDHEHWHDDWREHLDAIAMLDGGATLLPGDHWTVRGRQTQRGAWSLRHALTARDEASAKAALALRPETTLRSANYDQHEWAYTGRALLRAGEYEEAIPWLEKASRVCRPLTRPFLLTRTHAWLGEALEGAGRAKEACAPYAAVLRRWGSAKPRSLTADAVRKRAAAIGCEARRDGEPGHR